MLIPNDLRARTESAIKRISSGQAPMRVPVDPTDPDVVLAEWLRAATDVPPVGREAEVLAVVTLGGYFSSDELGDIDIEPRMPALEQVQQDIVRSDSDEHLELVDRAHVTRLQAEVSALQQLLNIADQRASDLTWLAKSAYMEGWELGWVTRHTDANNEKRVTPWAPPREVMEREWLNSEGRAALNTSAFLRQERPA
jgi:hypothetical protein